MIRWTFEEMRPIPVYIVTSSASVITRIRRIRLKSIGSPKRMDKFIDLFLGVVLQEKASYCYSQWIELNYVLLMSVLELYSHIVVDFGRHGVSSSLQC